MIYGKNLALQLGTIQENKSDEKEQNKLSELNFDPWFEWNVFLQWLPHK